MRKVSLASDDPAGSINKCVLFFASMFNAYGLKLGYARISSSQTSRTTAQIMAAMSLKAWRMLLSPRSKQMSTTPLLLDAEGLDSECKRWLAGLTC
jgi:hypothetical protein